MDESRQYFSVSSSCIWHHVACRVYSYISKHLNRIITETCSVPVQLSMIAYRIYKTISRLFCIGIVLTRLDFQFTVLNSDWGLEIGLENSKPKCKKCASKTLKVTRKFWNIKSREREQREREAKCATTKKGTPFIFIESKID